MNLFSRVAIAFVVSIGAAWGCEEPREYDLSPRILPARRQVVSWVEDHYRGVETIRAAVLMTIDPIDPRADPLVTAEYRGHIWVRRPGSFRIVVVGPSEWTAVSDGHAVLQQIPPEFWMQSEAAVAPQFGVLSGTRSLARDFAFDEVTQGDVRDVVCVSGSWIEPARFDWHRFCVSTNVDDRGTIVMSEHVERASGVRVLLEYSSVESNPLLDEELFVIARPIDMVDISGAGDRASLATPF